MGLQHDNGFTIACEDEFESLRCVLTAPQTYGLPVEVPVNTHGIADVLEKGLQSLLNDGVCDTYPLALDAIYLNNPANVPEEVLAHIAHDVIQRHITRLYVHANSVLVRSSTQGPFRVTYQDDVSPHFVSGKLPEKGLHVTW